jgi:phosphinothricin acetyltransferase
VKGDRPRIRPPQPSDLPELTEIYNHYIVSSAVTFDVEPFEIEERRAWFEHYSATGRHQLFVADSGGRVVGYATSSSFRGRAAYDPSVETTVYLAPDHIRQGIGSQLYHTLFDALGRQDVHRAYAGITLPNPASLALHRSFGFRPVGVYDEVGRKFGRFWSVEWLEKKLP